MTEKLSTMLDDELSRDEFENAFRETVADDELMKTVSRYQLIGAMMRREGTDASCHVTRVDVAARVASSIEHEPEWLLPKAASPAPQVTADHATAEVVKLERVRSVKPAFFGGFAAAAAISALAVLVVSPNWLSGEQNNPAPVAAVAPAPESSIPMDEDNLTSLLVEHGEFSGSAGINGLIAYAKFVSHDGDN